MLCIAFYGKLISQLQSVTCYIGLHSVCYLLPETGNALRLTTARQAGTQFIYLGGIEG